MDEERARIEKDIQSWGCHVIRVPEDDEGPGFAFSIGFHERFDHPEVIVTGLPLDLMHDIVNGIAEVLLEGKRYEVGQRYGEILDAYECAFVEVDRSFYYDFLGTARWYYGNDDFDVLQCVWPDRDGRYPWDDACAPGLVEAQPLLNRPDASS